jgi:hypothetical protein
MPVHIQRLETRATVATGDFQLSEAQMEELIQTVLKRLQEQQRDEKRSRAATMLRSGATSDEPYAGGAGWD